MSDEQTRALGDLDALTKSIRRLAESGGSGPELPRLVGELLGEFRRRVRRLPTGRRDALRQWRDSVLASGAGGCADCRVSSRRWRTG